MRNNAVPIRKLLHLKRGELSRSWPFFALYVVLFGAFALADGLSLALFVEHVGARALPLYYGLTAAANLVLIGGYVLVAERLGGLRAFQLILLGSVAVFAAAWAACKWFDGGGMWYGALFVAREVAFTLLLMHFGTYLQDYFTRDQLNRVLPVIYAGGRVGGIAGGWLLERLSGWPGPLDAVPVFLGLCLLGVLALEVISGAVDHVHTAQDERNDPAAVPPEARDAEHDARSSFGGFLRFAFASPLLLWLSVSSVLFMVARWALNYRYNLFFDAHFHSPAELAAFLGRYTQLALLLSLAVQLFVVNRLVAFAGVHGAYLLYGLLMFGGSLIGVGEMTLTAAVCLRLLETELRLGLRNPLVQVLTNKFSRPLRLRVRAWTMGMLTPLGTGLASALLAVLSLAGAGAWAGWAAAAVALAFLLSTAAVYLSLRPPAAPRPAPEAARPQATS